MNEIKDAEKKDNLHGYEDTVIERAIETIKKLRGQHKGLSEALLRIYYEGFKQGVYTASRK
jgi:hypothetical protein